MTPRPIDQWRRIFTEQRGMDPAACADRLLGDVLGYGSPKRSVDANGWRERDAAEIASALIAFAELRSQEKKP